MATRKYELVIIDSETGTEIAGSDFTRAQMSSEKYVDEVLKKTKEYILHALNNGRFEEMEDLQK